MKKLFSLFLLCLASTAFGQAAWYSAVLNNANSSAAGGGGAGCAVYVSTGTTQDSYNVETDTSHLDCQAITNVTGTVCKIRLYVSHYNSDSSAQVMIRDANNGGGSLVGSMSDMATVPSTGLLVFEWVDFTWTSGAPVLNGANTYWLYLVPSAGQSIPWASNSSATGFFYWYSGGFVRNDQCLDFELWK